MGLLPPTVAELVLQNQEFMAGLAESKGAMADMSDSGSASFGKLASQGAVLGGALVAVAGIALDLGMKYQASTATLAANADISVSAAQKIADAFESTGGKTVFSAQEMMTAYSSVAAQLGLVEGHALTAGQALSFMNTASDLAEASGASLSSATTDLANVIQTYGLKVTAANEVSNILFNTARLTGTSIDTVTTSFDRLHTSLGDLTPPLSQVGGLLVDLTAHGETGRAALSAVNTATTALLKPTEDYNEALQSQQTLLAEMPPNLRTLAQEYANGTITSSQFSTATQGLSGAQAQLVTAYASAVSKGEAAKEAIDAQGISVETASGKFVGWASVITQLDEKMKGETQSQQLATLATGFGASANRKLLDVVLAGPAAYEKYTAQVSAAGSAHEAAEKHLKTFEDELKEVETKVEDEGVALGEWLIPKVELLAHDGLELFDVLDHDKVLLVALAAGAVYAGAALGAFALDKIAGAVGWLEEMGTSAINAGAEMLGMDAPFAAVATDEENAATQAAAMASAQAEATASMTSAMSDLAAAITENTETIQTQMESLGESLDPAVSGVSGAADTINADLASIDEQAAITKGSLADIGAGADIGVAGGAGALALDGTAAAAEIKAAGVTAGEDMAAGTKLGGEEAGAEIKAAEITGGKTAAGEIKVAEGEGGAVAGVEEGGGEVLGGGGDNEVVSGVSGGVTGAVIEKVATKAVTKSLAGGGEAGVVGGGAEATAVGGEAATGIASLPALAAVAIPLAIAYMASHPTGKADRTVVAAGGWLDHIVEDVGLKSAGGGKGGLGGYFAAQEEALAKKDVSSGNPALVMAGEQYLMLQQIHADQAKDKSLAAQTSDLKALEENAKQQTSEYGVGSKQSEAALKALGSSVDKWTGTGAKDTTLSSKEEAIRVALAWNTAKLDTLHGDLLTATKDGTLVEWQSRLKEATDLLQKDETGGATKDAINEAKNEVKTAEGHIDAIKSDTAKIAKTEDIESTDKNELSALKVLDADQQALKAKLSAVDIASLPDGVGTLAGAITLALQS
jgi:hypothetical protein